MRRIKNALMLAATVLLLVCCDKENLVSQRNGRDISFYACVAGTGTEQLTKADVICSDADTLPLTWTITDGIVGQTAPGTQTLTKGALINNGTDAEQLGSAYSFQLVSWTGSTQFYPTEGVATISYNSSKWQPSSGNSPQWPESGDVTFYAVANLPSSGANWTNTSNTSANLTYTVPASASAQNDILMGYYKGQGNNGTAELTFYHPLTAVVFKMGYFENAYSSIAFKSISIDGVYNKGEVTQSVDNESKVNFLWNTAKATAQTVTLAPANGNLTVDDNNVIGEPFLLIPQSLTSSSSVTITVNATVDGVDAVFAKTLTSGEWQAGKTNTYTLGFTTGSSPVLTVSGSVSTDYSAVVGTNSFTVSANDSWKLQYSTDNGTNWVDAVKDDLINEWISFHKVSGTPGIYQVNATVLAAGNSDLITSDAADIHDTRLREANPNGLPNRPYDLSMHDIYGNERAAGKPVTANSYVINGPGWYAFPLVYGNAIDYNKVPVDGVNSKAYKPVGLPANDAQIPIPPDNTKYITAKEMFLYEFLNYRGDAITTPYIEDDLGVAVSGLEVISLWQDVGNAVVDNCSLVARENLSAYGLTANNCSYVVFRVDKTNLKQSNVVIAVRSGNDIVWSWHIWITDQNLSCKSIKPVPPSSQYYGTSFPSEEANAPVDMMPVNLGWVDGPNTATVEYYKGRVLDIRFVIEKEGAIVKSEPFIVERKEKIVNIQVDGTGSCTLYQWGRKDPMPRGEGAATANELTSVLVHSDYSGIDNAAIKIDKSSQTLPYSIKYPNSWLRYKNNSEIEWYHVSDINYCYYCNLWGTNITKPCFGSLYSDDLFVKPYKSVYDPCPPGFVVPNYNSLSRLHNAGINSGQSDQYGLSCYLDDSESETMYFPLSGCRSSSDPPYGSLSGREGDYWSATTEYDPQPDDPTRRKLLGMSIYSLSSTYGSSSNSSNDHPASAYAVRPIAE